MSSDLRVAQSVFLVLLLSWNSDALGTDGVCALVMAELNVSFFETVILSVPDDQRTLVNIQPLWSALEEYVSQQRIYSVGISDLSKTQLEELYNWATVSTVTRYSPICRDI